MLILNSNGKIPSEYVFLGLGGATSTKKTNDTKPPPKTVSSLLKGKISTLFQKDLKWVG